MALLALLLVLVLMPAPAWAIRDVVNTVHNLSVTGPGVIKSLTVAEVCVFCHTPHNAQPDTPLWNHEMPAQWYIEYGSTTLKASPGQPTGKSRLCLACHDGTVALGALGNPPYDEVVDLDDVFLTGRADLGTDLTNDHPISFIFDSGLRAQNPQLADPHLIDLPLEEQQVQCTTCHDAHERDIVPFLRRTTRNGALCTTCHVKAGETWDWGISPHATSAATPTGTNPWSERKPEWRGQTVAENACLNCHQPHNAVTPERLIKDREEDTCYLCHNKTVADTDIQAEFSKPSRHPVSMFSGVHDPVEDVLRASRHVECADCHNVHGAYPIEAVPPAAPGTLRGVKGVTAQGTPVPEAEYEYEVCFACHADNNALSSPEVPRQITEINTRLEFDPGNPSYHPVESIGRNTRVPSLLWPLTTTSMIYCSDCHTSNDSPQGGGTGPKGPHGSIFSPLLARNYTTADNTPESAIAYDLCYRCHDRSSILSDQSFKEHRKHIQEERAPCSACHDPHGISSTTGNSVNNSHLINFDVTIVSSSRKLGGPPRFEDRGDFRGSCTLTCHGEDHDDESY